MGQSWIPVAWVNLWSGISRILARWPLPKSPSPQQRLILQPRFRNRTKVQIRQICVMKFNYFFSVYIETLVTWGLRRALCRDIGSRLVARVANPPGTGGSLPESSCASRFQAAVQIFPELSRENFSKFLCCYADEGRQKRTDL